MQARLLEMLANLGQRIREVDRVYAARVSDAILPEEIQGRGGVGNFARAMGTVAAGQPAFEKPFEMKYKDARERLVGETIKYGVPISNVAIRYGMPIAGVTAAGQGLGALAQALSNSSDEDVR